MKRVVEGYMQRVSGIEEHCNRCLETERWDGSVVLMVVDAAFASIGLNYFTSVVPKVQEFSRRFMVTKRITDLEGLAGADLEELRGVWRNKRSWNVARRTASHLSTLKGDDRTALRAWARGAVVERWRKNPVGRIRGVGLVTFQYLRMMGGVDTVMPDKIVKRVINQILERAGLETVEDDMMFIETVEETAHRCGYRPTELCWMTWLVQPEGEKMRMDKYSEILPNI